MSGFDYDELDPGIREVVRLLRAHGLHTCDSGDGVTKLGEMGCALPYPNVVVQCAPADIASTADLMLAVLANAGVEVLPLGPDSHESGDPTIEASYDPTNRIAVVVLTNVDDSRLAARV